MYQKFIEDMHRVLCNIRDNPAPDEGICEQVDRGFAQYSPYTLEWLHAAFREWPKFSGYVFYPVPHQLWAKCGYSMVPDLRCGPTVIFAVSTRLPDPTGRTSTRNAQEVILPTRR